MKRKVFGIGSPRTGTTTLGYGLQVLNYKSCLGGSATANLLMPMITTKDYENLFKFIDGFESFDDVPFAHGDVYKILYDQYPEAKFILTERYPQTWYESFKFQLSLSEEYMEDADNDLTKFIKKNNMVLTPLDKCLNFGWSGLYDHINLTYGNISFPKSQSHIINVYKQRNQEVKNFFSDKPDRLLVIDICNGKNEENFKILKNFLGIKSKINSFQLMNDNKRNIEIFKNK